MESWERTEVEGVPTFYAEHPGDLQAALIFRVGHADERLAIRGITHLVEHLALHQVGQPVHAYNGQVDTITTAFTTQGSPEEVVSFLTAVCRSLSDLPFDRMEAENRVLLAEAEQRSSGWAGPLALWRYGAATYGLPGYGELGVGHHGEEQVADWVSRWFTCDNAVLALIGGPPPEGLRLELPTGKRMPPPAPTSALPYSPAFFDAPVNGVAMSGVVPRSSGAQAYAALLGRRLHKALRLDAALSYSPSASYDPRDATMAQITAFADGLREDRPKLAAGFVTEIERLATEPVSTEEIGQVISQFGVSRRDPHVIAGAAVSTAVRELIGADRLSAANIEAEILSLDAEAIQQVAVQALDSALFMFPEGYEPGSRRYRPAPVTSTGTIRGRTLRNADAPIDPARMIIGSDGISLVVGPRYVTVMFAECEVMFAWPDGGRRLIGRDGFTLQVEPTLWVGGESLPAALDQGVPADRVICQPARPVEEIPSPKTSRYDRARARFKRR